MKNMNLTFDDRDFDNLVAAREHAETASGSKITSWESFFLAVIAK